MKENKKKRPPQGFEFIRCPVSDALCAPMEVKNVITKTSCKNATGLKAGLHVGIFASSSSKFLKVFSKNTEILDKTIM